MSYYVYILFSKGANKYYIGQSKNVEERLSLHNNSDYQSYTSKFAPWEIKLIMDVGENRGIAMRIEKYLKRQKSRKFIERLIESEELQNSILNRFQSDNKN